jgi:hypothetical protein
LFDPAVHPVALESFKGCKKIYYKKLEGEKKAVEWIALDPGIKTFLFGVDSNGDTYEFGWGLGDEIKGLQQRYSQIQNNPLEVIYS